MMELKEAEGCWMLLIGLMMGPIQALASLLIMTSCHFSLIAVSTAHCRATTSAWKGEFMHWHCPHTLITSPLWSLAIKAREALAPNWATSTLTLIQGSTLRVESQECWEDFNPRNFCCITWADLQMSTRPSW